MRVLLIGGGGFMGTPTALAMRAAGHDVAVLTRGRRPLPEGVEAIVGDRSDAASLGAALSGRSFDFTVDFVAYDAPDVERLFHVPRAALGRYVLISTGQVYLVVRRPPGFEARPFREEDSEGEVEPEPPAGTFQHGNWEYGVGKRRAEQALLALGATHGVRGLSLRLPIVQGARDGSRRLWAYLQRLMDGGPILLPDGGRKLVRQVWAGDVVRALTMLLEGAATKRPAYNLAQPDLVTVRALLERVAALAGVTPRFVDVTWEEVDAAGLAYGFSPYGGRWGSQVDPSAAGEWGFHGTPLDVYLPEVVRWHLETRPPSHPDYAHRDRELALAERLAGRSVS